MMAIDLIIMVGVITNCYVNVVRFIWDRKKRERDNA